jgi:YD repeat-containing protein
MSLPALNGPGPSRATQPNDTNSPNRVQTSSSSASGGPSSADNGQSPPAIAAPSGGGAIKSMNEAFNVDLASGTSSLKLPLPLTHISRWGMPQLSLEYDSGAGNGVFGLGWDLLGVPAISRKTVNTLPTYLDEQDIFVLGGDELVPLFKKSENGEFLQDSDGTYPFYEEHRDGYYIKRYRPRVDQEFDRIERWTKDSDPDDIHWRVISPTNITQIFGRTPLSRAASDSRIFRWNLCEAYDTEGGAQLFEWKAEDGANVDGYSLHEQNRTDDTRSSCKLLKRIKYGNRMPNRKAPDWKTVTPASELPDTWLFELVFDYGEHDITNPKPNDDKTTFWPVRKDPFSTYMPGFEIRTYRLCKRLLMYHNFPDEPDYLQNTLVSSLELHYHQTNSISFLKTARHVGYKQDVNSPQVVQNFPPIELKYTKVPSSNDLQNLSLHSFDEASMQNVDVGRFDWVDLLGDGTTGLLARDGESWWYKRNLSTAFTSADTILASPSNAVEAKVSLGALQTIPIIPNLGSGDSSVILSSFVDIDGDGITDLMVYGSGIQGFYRGISQFGSGSFSWQDYKPFQFWPSVDLTDQNLRMIDLTGDGRADIMITNDDEIVWYPFLGEAGFGPSQEVSLSLNEERGSRVLFSDPTQSIYLADMSGDGLVDIVRIRYSDACYWPNMGYGNFGAKVTMDNFPAFDRADNFNMDRVLLCDVDGSGTNDIFYFGPSGAILCYNESGNSWSQPISLDALVPSFDSLTKITAVDLLGTGTSCLVWCSSASSLDRTSSQSLQYVDLMNGVKPHLLTRWNNNIGSQTTISYRSSTYFYLMDEQDGNPWVTRLPYPVQCVEKVVKQDLVNKSLLVDKYHYHHGYYDGVEREFRGFGMVEHWDTEDFDFFEKVSTDKNVAQQDRAVYTSPTLQKVWFHIGAFEDVTTMREVYAREFSPLGRGIKDPRDVFLSDFTGTDYSELELREATRALKGITIRKELYRKDITTDLPFETEEAGGSVRMIQPQGQNAHAVFQTYENGALSLSCESDIDDLRVNQKLSLEVDNFGNVTKSVHILYGRNKDKGQDLDVDDQKRQQQTRIIYAESEHTNSIDTATDYLTPHLASEKHFEITALDPVGGTYYAYRDFGGLGDFAPISSCQTLDYHEVPPDSPAKRLFSWHITLYRADNLQIDLLSFKTIDTLALPGQSYELCFTKSMASEYMNGNQSLLPSPDVFTSAGYMDVNKDGSWWKPSSLIRYCAPGNDELVEAQLSFFRPKQLIDPFKGVTISEYDPYFLVPIRTIDAAGNQTSAHVNYKLLLPSSITDANDNRTDFAYDAMGRVVGIADVGKAGVNADSLTDFNADLAPSDITSYISDPLGQSAKLLANATVRFIYDDSAYMDSQSPIWNSKLSSTTRGIQSNKQIELQIIYQDGTGRIVQKKQPTSEKEWLTSGWTVYNNKGLDIQTYEPFLDVSPAFNFDARAGYSAIKFYDATERLVATLLPNHTWSKTVYDTWSIALYDENDLVDKDPSQDADVGFAFRHLPPDTYLPTWYDQQINSTDDDLKSFEIKAAAKSLAHKDTPNKLYSDALGHSFLSISNTGTELIKIRTLSDIQGYQLSEIDGLGRVATATTYDMTGTAMLAQNLDYGLTWNLADVIGRTIYTWYGTGVRVCCQYDSLRRPTATLVKDGEQAEICTAKIKYGDSLDVEFAKSSNLLGRCYEMKDQAGVRMNKEYDLKGNCTLTEQQLASNYKTMLNWNEDQSLEPTIYSTAFNFDALNRVISTQTPDNSVTSYDYNINGLLSMIKSKSGSGDWVTYVSSISYDEHLREIERVQDQNGTTVSKVYDPISQRLSADIIKQSSKTLEFVNYIYDAIGNLVFEVDKTDQTIYFRNNRVDPKWEYTHDATYRLKIASGREHLGQTNGQPFSATPLSASSNPGSGLAPGDGTAVAAYTETYAYDLTGNMLSLQHVITDTHSPGWTQKFQYTSPSLIQQNEFNNRLTSTQVGNVTQNYAYDANGNTISAPNISKATWDYTSQLRSTVSQVNNSGTPETVWLVYITEYISID